MALKWGREAVRSRHDAAVSVATRESQGASSHMADIANIVALSLIDIHRADALKVAEHAADNIRPLGMAKTLEQWNQVIAAIKKIQGAAGGL
jgi:hypothetical protein